MAYIGNAPQQKTVLQIEARKSFVLLLRFLDANRRPADLTGCSVTFTVKAVPLDATDVDDSDNLVTSSTAVITDAADGRCQFDVQASELDLLPAEYPYAIVLRTPDGYSILAVKGVLQVLQNTEFSSMGYSFTSSSTTQGLEVTLRGSTSLDVRSSAFVPPGMTWMSEADKEKIDGLSEAANLLPAGGLTGQMLAKETDEDYEFRWVNPQAFDGTLDATGQPAFYAPVSNGDGTWDWAEVSTIVDWNTPAGQPGSILNKPTLGTAASQNVEAFAAATHQHDGADINAGQVAADFLPRLTELRGVTISPDPPVDGTGVDGDVHLQYLPEA